MIFIDAHVHIYDCFDLDILFDSTLTNFQTAAKRCGISNQFCSYMLLLSEGISNNWFQHLVTKINTGQNITNPPKKWTFSPPAEPLSLTACQNDSSQERIYLVAGRQIVTAERIEILALFCNSTISDGLSLNETIDTIRQFNGIPVIPWGAGKWFGKRGKILQGFLDGYGKKGLFLGDNGGRPLFWPTPALFHLARKKGISVLPGTDPLPLAHEAIRVGSFGFFLDHPSLDMESPATAIRDLLITGQKALSPFGQLQSPRSFFRNQLQLRLHS